MPWLWTRKTGEVGNISGSFGKACTACCSGWREGWIVQGLTEWRRRRRRNRHIADRASEGLEQAASRSTIGLPSATIQVVEQGHPVAGIGRFGRRTRETFGRKSCAAVCRD